MSNNSGIVSVIVPVYNVEKYFDECIKSVLEQTYQNLEILIVDDGTKDNCGKKADEYARTDKRIKVFHKENGGLSSARNWGLRHATGDYYCFIDSDDYYEPEFVEKMINAAVKSDADIVFCNFYSCYINKNLPSSRLFMLEDGREFSPEEFLRLFYTYSGAFASAWNKLYKKEIFKDLEYKNMLCEDAQILLSLVDRCKKLVFISDVLYHYRRRKSSIVNANREEMLLCQIRWLKEHMERLKASKRYNLYNLAQKLYIRKQFEEYHFCNKETRRKTIRPLLKKEMKLFMRNSEIDAKLRLKYFAVSLIPYIYGEIAFEEEERDLFWD